MLRISRKSLFVSMVIILLFVILSSISQQVAQVLPFMMVVILAFLLRDLFVGARKIVPEDRINQGEDPLSQYFNKYDGL